MKTKKEYLDLMNSYSYEEYKQFQSEGLIVKEILIDTGFICVKDNGESYGIRISFEDDYLFTYDLIKEYVESNKDKIYVLMNGRNNHISQIILQHGFREMYSAYEMTLDLSDGKDLVLNYSEDDILKLIPYHPSHFLDYIKVLGSFGPMREELKLEPYDWYGNNHEEAKKKFEHHMESNSIFGYWEEGTLIAVGMIENNEIDTVAVDISYQKQGYGHKLIKTLIKLIYDRGQKQQFLSVMAVNQKAIRLYEKVGFELKCKMLVYEKKRV